MNLDSRTILITGATGFVGTPLVARLRQDGYTIRVAGRHEAADVRIASLDETTRWQGHLDGIHTVIHLAAHVHVMSPRPEDAQAFHRVNVLGTHNLAEAAAQAGVSRFIFLSTVKVHGEFTTAHPWTESSPIEPHDAYARSKAAAEEILRSISASTRMETVIVRPPLVYGPGVKANFHALMKAVRRGIPLPLGRLHNRRSMIYLGNLADLLTHCVRHPHAGNKAFLVSDGTDMTLPELVMALAAEMRATPRLFSFPQWMLRAAATLAGKTAALDRLTSALQIDSSYVRKELQWTPPFTMQEGLHDTVYWFLAHSSVS
jgi:nucleoside-diphosphate-sugar epimerase